MLLFASAVLLSSRARLVRGRAGSQITSDTAAAFPSLFWQLCHIDRTQSQLARYTSRLLAPCYSTCSELLLLFLEHRYPKVNTPAGLPSLRTQGWLLLGGADNVAVVDWEESRCASLLVVARCEPDCVERYNAAGPLYTVCICRCRTPKACRCCCCCCGCCGCCSWPRYCCYC